MNLLPRILFSLHRPIPCNYSAIISHFPSHTYLTMDHQYRNSALRTIPFRFCLMINMYSLLWGCAHFFAFYSNPSAL
ncbi:hypothetical protein BDQ12DRAFT_186942 [Crucibulum laeve]|uniref:Uncharacterized protein n=1 Tax=Crucibulum laeve TaxID=68775 RepID=A0A5C3MI27_9AGAR|nr:hypothetical protein BDQ12DRAFT_186942 [Crucibulum laeve]